MESPDESAAVSGTGDAAFTTALLEVAKGIAVGSIPDFGILAESDAVRAFWKLFPS